MAVKFTASQKVKRDIFVTAFSQFLDFILRLYTRLFSRTASTTHLNVDTTKEMFMGVIAHRFETNKSQLPMKDYQLRTFCLSVILYICTYVRACGLLVLLLRHQQCAG